ncbi:hypothetical protein M2164_003493 [Streptomyces sp. SAI-208]|jgi:hypothetical protein|uniref:DUF4429 domain-containing protein n=1 Tax=unclassified Streptomyces TaxID=2593676 RepID=UPI0024730723|nr:MULTISPECIES: DUF4429 domain-containing protein [unclassified Streptomyces]MDH6517039.1 hypothetical protein [Streptomyces sp. SAI-090]MDH6549253.1 hypothetical protein [Streptomyces sp. SAI-041]MDH6568319.1 hypothetical protein [Streptomyces sp. SAI-117]MDH6586732.1 hypothetical protein [Streptomyces sp. SAI-133]MDH6607858.1 hypothetical protein [Streptomyces sp. SAI-208]
MAEIIQRDGTWAFDGTTVRITPGLHRSVPLFRQTYGEVAVPLEAIAGVAFEPERKRGRLRMRLREGADPLLHATGGRLPDPADPYRLTVDVDRAGVAEYVAEEIRHALLLDQVPKEPTKTYLLPGPPVPVSVRSSDGTVSFDGTQVRIDWADTSDRVKRATGPRIIDVGDLVQVEWLPNSGYEDGFMRFVTRETSFSKLPPEKDPYALDLWGSTRRDLLTALVATAVTARLPHPSTRGDLAYGGDGARRPGLTAAAVPPPADHHDALLRRLRELGELHRAGVLTDEEFAMTKAAVLRGF